MIDSALSQAKYIEQQSVPCRAVPIYQASLPVADHDFDMEHNELLSIITTKDANPFCKA